MTGSARYDAVAAWYVDAIGDAVDDPATSALLELTGEVDGRCVLELGCGHGRLARALAQLGAAVTGVDISHAMLEAASMREAAAPLGITYIHGDVASCEDVNTAAFNVVVCNLALADIEDLAGAIRTARRAVVPGGAFVFSIPHPCFQGSGAFDGPSCHFLAGTDEHPAGRLISGYFEEVYWRSADPSGVRGKVGAHHRTLSTYLNTLADAGLRVECVVEPRPTRSDEHPPGYDEVPVFFIARCRAPAARRGPGAS